MARGFLSGVFWGGVVSVTGLATASILAGGPQRPSATVAVTEPTEVAAAAEATGGQAPTSRNAPMVIGGSKTPAEAPAPDTIDSAAVADRTGAMPQASQQTAGLDDPAAQQSAGMDVQGDAPVLPNPQALAPQSPGTEAELSISTEPAQPVAPDVSDQETAFAEAPAAPEPELSDAPVVAQTEVEAVTLLPQIEPSQGTSLAVVSDPAPKAEASVIAKPQAGETPAAVETPEPPKPAPTEPETEQTADPAPEPKPEPEAPATAPRKLVIASNDADENGIGDPAGNLKELAPQVAVNRLPTLRTAETTAPEEDAPQTTGIGSGATPLEQFGVAFDNPDDKPLMAIVLIDDGQITLEPALLAELPFPISFAVPFDLPDAAARMARLRKAGIEVMALVDLPSTGGAAEAEAGMEVALGALPEVVGVLEGTKTGLQGSRALSDQVTGIVAQTGHGLVLQSKGLNTAQKLAVKAGVPAAVVFRDFDAKDQKADVIRRFLDQAAFKAGQEGAVIMQGRVRAETLNALLVWGLQDRAQRVALAPVSAVLAQ